MICSTDLKVICTECGLFGIHKDHKYQKFDIFKQKALKDLLEMKEKKEQTKMSSLSKKLIEKEKSHLTQKVNTKKDGLITEVKRNMKNLREILKQKEKEMLEDINKYFFKFDTSID